MDDEDINDPEIPEIMTPRFILGYLQFIKQISGDDERAHSMEDNIHRAVLKAISLGKCQDIAKCCKEVLKSEEISFSRWCA